VEAQQVVTRSSNFKKRGRNRGPSGAQSVICNKRYLSRGDQGSKASRAASASSAEQVQHEVNTWFLPRYIILQVGVKFLVFAVNSGARQISRHCS
jgi:hypothetical protein